MARVKGAMVTRKRRNKDAETRKRILGRQKQTL